MLLRCGASTPHGPVAGGGSLKRARRAARLQVYEDTSGLTVGDTVIRSGKVRPSISSSAAAPAALPAWAPAEQLMRGLYWWRRGRACLACPSSLALCAGASAPPLLV